MASVQQPVNDVKINITKLNIMCDWVYKGTDITNYQCKICRKNLMSHPPDDVNMSQLIPKISFGKCGHSFHTYCISKTLKNNSSCPIDQTPWNLEKEYEGDVESWKIINTGQINHAGDNIKVIKTKKLLNKINAIPVINKLNALD